MIKLLCLNLSHLCWFVSKAKKKKKTPLKLYLENVYAHTFVSTFVINIVTNVTISGTRVLTSSSISDQLNSNKQLIL